MPIAAIDSAGIGTLVALMIFMGTSVWLGTLAQKMVEKGTFLQGFFLGNRGLGAWALALTATVQSGGTFMGFPSFVYSHGWVVALWICGYMVVPITGFAAFGKRFAQLSRRTGAITVPDVLRHRYNDPRVGILASLLILFFMTVMMIAQFKAGAIVMQIALPGSGALAISEETTSGGLSRYYYIGLVIFSLTVIGYTLIGGFLAAVWTDLFQSIMMFVGVMILLPLTLIASGGIAKSTERLRHEVSFKPPPNAASTDEKAVALRARIAEHARHEPMLQKVYGDLEAYAAKNSGLLPPKLAREVLGSTPTEEDLSNITYVGGGVEINSREEPMRQVIAYTAAVLDRDNGAPIRSVLYSNGKVRTGVCSDPGQMISGPGPHGWLPITGAFSMFFVWVFSGLGSPAGVVRVMASKSTSTIRRSIFLLAVYNMGIYLPLIVICICGRTLVPDLEYFNKSDEIIPRLSLLGTSQLPGGSWVAGLILAAPFGAVMATVSTYLVVIASGIVRDVYLRFINPKASEKTVKWLSRVAMVVVGGIAIGANIRPQAFLQDIVVFSGTSGACTFVVAFFMTAYWTRATAAGTIAAMLGGAGVVLGLYLPNLWMNGKFQAAKPFGFDAIIWGLSASLVAGIVVSLCTRTPPKDHLQKLFGPAPDA